MEEVQASLAAVKEKIDRLPADRRGKWMVSFTCTERSINAAIERGDERAVGRILCMVNVIDRHVTALLDSPYVMLPEWDKLG